MAGGNSSFFQNNPKPDEVDSLEELLKQAAQAASDATILSQFVISKAVEVYTNAQGAAASYAGALQALSDTNVAKTAAQAAASQMVPASATPLQGAGAGSVGTSPKYAREDHKHPVTQIPQYSLLGRLSSGTGDHETITATQVLDGTMGTTRGALIARGASVWGAKVPAIGTPLLGFDGLDTSWLSKPDFRNLVGSAAPLTPGASYTLLKADYDAPVFIGNANSSLVLPDVSTIPAGWRTGVITSMVVVGSPAVISTNPATPTYFAATYASVSSGLTSLALAWQQRISFVWDGTYWRIIWVDRTPLLYVFPDNLTVTNADYHLPEGYAALEIRVTNYRPISGNGGQLLMRLSLDGGSTYKASGYTTQLFNATGTTTNAASSSATGLVVIDTTTNTTHTTGRAGSAQAVYDCRYGGLVTNYAMVTPQPAGYIVIAKSYYDDANTTKPTVVRFVNSSGYTWNGYISIRGLPAQ